MSRALLVTLSAILVLTMFLGGADALAAKSPTVRSSLRALVRQTNALPTLAASARQRRTLRATARHALAYARLRPCVSVRDLARYRGVLRKVKVRTGRRYRRPAARLSALGPASLKATRLLLASKRTKSCGGGVKPSTGKQTKVVVLRSNANGMKLRVQLPELRFGAQTGGGKAWIELSLPNTDSPGAPGTPGIPVASSIFGVPDGAKLVVKTTDTTSYTIDSVDVYPAQPDVVDDDPPPDFDSGTFATPPFTLNKGAYARDRLVPSKPADGDMLGTSRDLVLGGLQIPAVQYNAHDHKLKVLKSVDVTLQFEGGPHTFSDELASPWEHAQRQVVASLLNKGVVRPRLFEIIRRCGEEMLVITNPATLTAADNFATAKRAQGMRTSVFQTGTGAGQIGTTPAAIQSFIRGRLTAFLCMHPSYVTIMGDDDLVPTFPGINGIPSDLQYSMKNDADELPDVAVGRIIGNDQAAVGTAVTKIVNYETTAPTGNFLTSATIAAQFQDDNADGQENRTFIQFAETVRNGLVNRNVAVDRIYGDHPASNPQRFNDGTALPAALLKPGFAWDGDGADVSAAWNAGRFMVIHRDHGWSDGWGTPGFGTADVNALTNGANLPVVLSINCSSGAYDYDETSFAGESLVKANGGSVGVFGDTRDSPSWHNSQIALGFVDGLLPSILPAEGPALKQRTGNALINGKLRLAGLAPPSTAANPTVGDGSTRNELYLWHYFGDPSMQMWGGGSVLHIDPSLLAAIYEAVYIGPPRPDPPPYKVHVTLPSFLAGQPISLLRNGQVIGKGIAGAGFADIPASFGDNDPNPGELQVAIDADGYEPVSIPVGGVMTMDCPGVPVTGDTRLHFFPGNSQQVSGQASGAPLGSTISIETMSPSSVVRNYTTQTTNAAGDWTFTIPGSDTDEEGQWTIEATYAGDANHAPMSGECTVVGDQGVG